MGFTVASTRSIVTLNCINATFIIYCNTFVCSVNTIRLTFLLLKLNAESRNPQVVKKLYKKITTFPTVLLILYSGPTLHFTQPL